jgi:hypothetical protein
LSGEYKLSFQTWHNSVSVEVVEVVVVVVVEVSMF